MNDELIKRLNENRDFKTFKEWLLMKILEIDSVDDLSKMSNQQAGEEAKIRLKAKAKLTEILSAFIIGEKKEPSIEQVQKVKDRAGL